MRPLNTVIVITYNQKNSIGRTLDSILCQKDFVYEIVVADDCSTDKNWDVIQSYRKKYPELIKPFRNSKNLGIFGNTESTFTKAKGDIIWFIAGDDELCPGLFEKANELIDLNNIDFINKAFTMYFDFKTIDPNGKTSIFRNNLVENYNPISLKIRQLISNRTSGISRKVFDKFYPVRKDIGIMADGLIDIQTQLFSEKVYYIKYIGSIYYTSIGISSRTDNVDLNHSEILYLQELLTNIKFSNGDKQWIRYLILSLKFRLNPNLKNLSTYIINFFKGVGMNFGFPFFFKELLRLILSVFKVSYKFLIGHY